MNNYITLQLVMLISKNSLRISSLKGRDIFQENKDFKA